MIQRDDVMHLQRLVLSCVALGALSLAACEREPQAAAASAEAVSPVAPNTQGASRAPSAPKRAPQGRLAVDTSTSKIEWIGAKVTGDHKGGFKGFTGQVVVGADQHFTSVSFEVDIKTIYSDHEKVTLHLLSPDFFDVKRFPKASFASTGIVAKAGENMTHEVTGDMELRGVKKTVTFPVTVKVDGESVIADADFKLNRKDFGIVYAGKADDLIKDDVGMMIHLEAHAPASP